MSMLPPDPLYIFKGDMGPVFCLMFKISKEDKRIYAGTQSGTVYIWNLKTNREAGTFKSSTSSCISLHFTGTNEEIITQDKEGVVRFWREKEDSWMLVTEIATDYYGFCQCNLYNDVLYVPLKKALIDQISVKSKNKLEVLKFCEDSQVNEIMSFKIFETKNEIFILIAYESCDIKLWGLNEQKMLSDIKVDECPMAVEFDVSSMKGICGSPTDKLLLFTVNEYFQINFKRNIILKNPGVASLAIRPDGKLVTVGCWDGKLRLYSMKTFTLLAVLDIHSSTVQDVIYANMNLDGEKPRYYLSAASKDGKISLWDLYN